MHLPSRSAQTMSKVIATFLTLAILGGCAPQSDEAPPAEKIIVYPASGDTNVNIDTPLTLTFSDTPIVGKTGFIRVYDVKTGALVDKIDLSIPASPLPSGRFPPNTNQAKIFALGRNSQMSDYQVNHIGGEDFHFHPIIVHENTATLYLHNNKLEYGRTYQITLSNGTLSAEGTSFEGISKDDGWTFTTKPNAPASDTHRVIVAADGSEDFSTVQGALDFAPSAPERPFEIFVKNGNYEELVFVKDKSNFTIRGESRDGVVVSYPNNSAFNPPRGGPSRRPAFSIYNVSDVQLSNFTIKNNFIGQAEALLVRGDKVVLDHMTLDGSGDALTTAGSIYMADSSLRGDGDTILAYATLYCLRCEISSAGPFVWPRTPEGQHGNIFVDSKFVYLDEPLPWTISEESPEGQKTNGVLARLPRNGPSSTNANFPHAEMVLINSQTQGIPEIGWGPVEDPSTLDWRGVFFAEYNTQDTSGRTIDMAKRHPIVRYLQLPEDKALIEKYSNPEFVLGWKPEIRAPQTSK